MCNLRFALILGGIVASFGFYGLQRANCPSLSFSSPPTVEDYRAAITLLPACWLLGSAVGGTLCAIVASSMFHLWGNSISTTHRWVGGISSAATNKQVFNYCKNHDAFGAAGIRVGWFGFAIGTICTAAFGFTIGLRPMTVLTQDHGIATLVAINVISICVWCLPLATIAVLFETAESVPVVVAAILASIACVLLAFVGGVLAVTYAADAPYLPGIIECVMYIQYIAVTLPIFALSVVVATGLVVLLIFAAKKLT